MGDDLFKHPIAVRDLIANPLCKNLGVLKEGAAELSSVLKSLRKNNNHNLMLIPFDFQRVKKTAISRTTPSC